MLETSQKFFQNPVRSLIMIAAGLFFLVGLTNCGMSSKKNNLPTEFIQNFIAKHETMTDPSLVYYYVKEERKTIAQRITTSVRIKKAEGTLESLQQATFDFSGLELKVVDQKEKYINDEPVVFLRVAVKGDLRINLPTEKQIVTCDDIIVIEMVRNEWKVTETNNPWS
jgi:hypothetical protein